MECFVFLVVIESLDLKRERIWQGGESRDPCLIADKGHALEVLEVGQSKFRVGSKSNRLLAPYFKGRTI